MAILDERGIFWLSDTPVPQGQFAPDASIAGTLSIDDDGHVLLELDSYFPTKHGPFCILNDQGKPFGRDIYGVLRTSNSRIILTGVIPNGAQVKSNGISSQEFVATDCLVGSFDFPANPLMLAFDGLEIELSGFEDWFRLQSIKVSRGNGRISAEYEQPPEAAYEVDAEKLTFHFDISGTGPTSFGDRLSIKQNVTLRFSLRSKETLEKLADLFRSLEELLVLLTDSEYRTPWPSIVLDPRTNVRWYFTRFRRQNAAEMPKRHNCLTYFPNVREAFGDIWSNWRVKRDQFGPGFYLYLGTRRGLSFYAEHRFINLIWGFEAYHRTKFPADPNSMSERIENIVEQISDKKDKRLVRSRLKHAHEPSLERRLFEIFNLLPIELDKERLQAFATKCAQARNGISHYGTYHGAGSYNDFILDLDRKSSALSRLFHCLLLNEIGVTKEITNNWMFKAWGSFLVKHDLVEVGLLDREVPQPPAISDPPR